MRVVFDYSVMDEQLAVLSKELSRLFPDDHIPDLLTSRILHLCSEVVVSQVRTTMVADSIWERLIVPKFGNEFDAILSALGAFEINHNVSVKP